MSNEKSTLSLDRFKEWASLFHGKLFVMLAAYADESETEAISAYGGYVATVNEWTQFDIQWRNILQEFDAHYFHFREWATASAVSKGNRPPPSDFSKNPYQGWKSEKLHNFLFAL